MAVLYWGTRGTGATILPDGTEYLKDENGRVEVPEERVEEFKALGYSDTPPADTEPATEAAEAPTAPRVEPTLDQFGNG